MTWRPSTRFPWARERPLLDDVAARAFPGRLSLDEEKVLRDTVWATGQDVRLREDIRFRETPWGRWILSADYLANDTLHLRLRLQGGRPLEVEEALAALDGLVQQRCVLCAADPRLVVAHGEVRLSAQELTTDPLIEPSVLLPDRYVTHLPIHTLRAAAASEPLGQWGRRAQDEIVDTLGWLQVSLPGTKLNERMFVARVEGHSMDDGRSGLRDGALAVFEFGAGDFDREPVVLARGAFDDPETGSYAVKRIRLEHGADGHIERFRLLSANPDKDRYPDIVVGEREAPSVTVLARFVAALSPEEHARTPHPGAPPRRRDLTSPEAIEKRRARLAKALVTFFGPPGAPLGPAGSLPDVPPDQETSQGAPAPVDTPLPWAARLELPACDPAALVATCGPLTGLPSKVRTLALQTGPHRRDLFASNVRTKRWREPIPPSSEPYVWTAVDFEEDLAEEMAGLTLPGLSAEAATVFRLDADGIGQRLATQAITPGNTYRLLVPPALAAADLGAATQSPSGAPAESQAEGDSPGETSGLVQRDGWRALDLQVPSPVPPTIVDLLRSIRVAVGADAYSAHWALLCPRDHRPARDGERYPCFAPEDAPCLAVAGPPTLLDGEVSVLLQGEHGSATLPLAAGEEWLIELSGLAAGNHVLEVVPLRTSIETTRLFFRIDAQARPLPRADIAVTLGEDPPLSPSFPASPPSPAAPGQTSQGAEERDLAALGTADLPLAVTAPPLWPVTAHWHGGARLRGPQVATGEDGSVDAGALLARSATARQDDPVGDLTLDFGELGLVVVRHRRQIDKAAQVELPRLLRERLPSLAAFAGQLDLLRSEWLDRICKLLGHRVEPLPLLATLDLPAGFAAFQLTTLRRKGPSFERAATAALLVPPARLPLTDGAALKESRAEGQRLARKLGLRTAIVTDGRTWAKVPVKSALMPSPIDLEDALRRAPLGGIDDFLLAFLAEEP